MNPIWHLYVVQDRAREHERTLRRHPPLQPQPPAPREPVTLRVDTVWDEEALARLAALAGRRGAAPGRYVVAVVDGEIVAAQPLDGGRAFADPFRRTAHLLPLLELRAQQLRGDPRRRRGLRRLAVFAAARPGR
jgi:hypothetical protein